MKHILIALSCLFLFSCVATQGALDRLSADIVSLQEKPYVTDEDVAKLEEDVESVKEAVAQDTENFIESVGNGGAALTGTGLLTLGVAAAQWWRNRNLPGSQRKPKA